MEVGLLSTSFKISGMKNMIFLYVVFISLISLSCDKEQESISSDSCLHPCSSDSLLGKLDTIWSVKLSEDGSNPGAQESIIYYDNRIYASYSNVPEGMISCYNTSDKGSIVWHYQNGQKDFINTFILPELNMVINKSWEIRLTLDMITGKEQSIIHSVERSGPRGIVLGTHLHYDEREDNDRTVHLRRSLVSNLSQVETLYTIDNNDIDNSKKSIESMNLWMDPSTGDSILIFQHRMLDRVDVVAWNMDKKEVVWRHDDITPNGNSNHQQILIQNDKAYFGGSVSFFCFDMRDGEIVWRFDDNSGHTPFMGLRSVVAKSINALVVTGSRDIFAFDIESGMIKWRRPFEGSISSGSPVYHDGIIYITGRGLLYAYRASDGELLWAESSSGIPLGPKTFQGELAIDRERGILYATSSDRLFAIRVYED